jgi:hypothetical protein
MFRSLYSYVSQHKVLVFVIAWLVAVSVLAVDIVLQLREEMQTIRHLELSHIRGFHDGVPDKAHEIVTAELTPIYTLVDYRLSRIETKLDSLYHAKSSQP